MLVSAIATLLFTAAAAAEEPPVVHRRAVYFTPLSSAIWSVPSVAYVAVGLNLPLREEWDLKIEGAFGKATECNVFDAPCAKPAAFGLTLSLPYQFSRGISRGVFVAPKVVLAAALTDAIKPRQLLRDHLGGSATFGLDVGYRVPLERIYAAFTIGLSFGYAWETADEGISPGLRMGALALLGHYLPPTVDRGPAMDVNLNLFEFGFWF